MLVKSSLYLQVNSFNKMQLEILDLTILAVEMSLERSRKISFKSLRRQDHMRGNQNRAENSICLVMIKKLNTGMTWGCYWTAACWCQIHKSHVYL